MARQIYINLPVKDLKKSIEFFTKLDFNFNAQFSNEDATCMIVDDNIFVMLLTEPFFKGFTKKEIPETSKNAQVILCLSSESKDKVDELVNKAVSAGGVAAAEKQDQGFMYGWGFQDLDGHMWETVWMQPMPQQ